MLTQNKDIQVTKQISQYGIVLEESETKTVVVASTVDSVIIAGTTAIASVLTTVDGIQSPNVTQYEFQYDPAGGDVYIQAENYLLSLDEFSNAEKS